MVFECLDRALCNQQWETMAPNTLVTHLYKIKSDQVKFLSSWLAHDGFQ